MVKPTDAEIAYFTHPDQAWLQQLWEPVVGEWYLTQYGKVDLIRNRLDIVSRRPEWRWLPTLSDLLGMIEKTGYRYIKMIKDQHGYSMYAFAHPIKVAEAVLHQQAWEIAAAELLRRLRDETTQ